eukprot:CAMPEP_0195282068 /NCGR_PEP_ID=MMETSP0707-20130614/1114_1 /TAXON_ID=33640 /ORGANISM="Asterionellopsis glacialis, Strain CCMP134" /LENGTH=635 /DNA_ID=CAMNT_0040341019 /DNA_START=121 /DNA_END=2028 /DNA_ORIENTATION=-
MKNFVVFFLFVENVKSFPKHLLAHHHSPISIWGDSITRGQRSNIELAAASQYDYLAESSYANLMTSINHGFPETKAPPPTVHVDLPDPASSFTMTAQYVNSITDSKMASLPDLDQFLQSSKMDIPRTPELDSAAFVEQWNQHLTWLGLQWNHFVQTFDQALGQEKIESGASMATWNEFVQSTVTATQQMSKTASIPKMEASGLLAKWEDFVKSAELVVMDYTHTTGQSLGTFATSSQTFMHAKTSAMNNIVQHSQATVRGFSSTVTSSLTNLVASSQSALQDMTTSAVNFAESSQDVLHQQATNVASSWTDMISSTSSMLGSLQNVDIHLSNIEFDTSALVTTLNSMTEEGQLLMYQLVHSSPYLEELANNGVLAPVATASLGIGFVMAAASIRKDSSTQEQIVMPLAEEEEDHEQIDTKVIENLRQTIEDLKTVEVDVHDLEVHLDDIEKAIADSVFTKDVTEEGTVTSLKADDDREPLSYTSVPDEAWIDHFVDGFGDANSVFMEHETEGTATRLREVNDKESLGHTSVVPDETWTDHFVDGGANEIEYDSSTATAVSTTANPDTLESVEHTMEINLDAFMSDDDLLDFEATFQAAQEAAKRNDYLAGRLKPKQESSKDNIGYVDAMGETLFM